MQSNLLITDIEVKDIRFPTSKFLDGSDVMNPDPVVIKDAHYIPLLRQDIALR